MEYENTSTWSPTPRKVVLILVLMEYENTPSKDEVSDLAMGLNPCSNGIRKYPFSLLPIQRKSSLNPCSNGIRKYLDYTMAYKANVS